MAQYKRVPEYLSRYGTPIARQDLVLEYPFCIARARVAIPVRSAGCATTTGELHRGAGAERARERAASPPDLARRGQMYRATPGAVTGRV